MAADQISLGPGEDGAAAAAPSARRAELAGAQRANALEPDDLDRQQIYCRRLGHYLTFSYCRRAEAGSPCPRAAECWYDRPEALRALPELFGPAAAGDRAAPPPAGKLESILAIVARVRQREGSGSSPG